MTISKEKVIAKITGMISAISKLSSKERQSEPSADYAKNYNKLRSLAVKLDPDNEELFPPEIPILEAAMSGGEFVRSTYGEILSYCEEIKELLQ